MDEREREFRAAILDAPGDIAPRLVFADWLQERGDLRGEWIALDCAPATDDGEMRRRALWQHYGAQWFRDDLGAALDRKIVYRNGFAHTVRLRAEELVPLDERLAAQPIDTLDVVCIPSAMAALAECSVLPKLRRLYLVNRFDDVDATSAVLHAATKIAELALHRAHGSTDERAAWQALERYERFAELEVIELGSIPTSAGRARWLAEQLPRVHTLRLVSAVDADALRMFVEQLPKLAHLRIENTYGTVIHDDVFADALAALPSLKTLTLEGCGLGERTAAQLSRLSLTELAPRPALAEGRRGARPLHAPGAHHARYQRQRGARRDARAPRTISQADDAAREQESGDGARCADHRGQRAAADVARPRRHDDR